MVGAVQHQCCQCKKKIEVFMNILEILVYDNLLLLYIVIGTDLDQCGLFHDLD